MVSNGDRFEGAYNKIDALLHKKFDRAKILPYFTLVVETATHAPRWPKGAYAFAKANGCIRRGLCC
jgi:hypothetical protein